SASSTGTLPVSGSAGPVTVAATIDVPSAVAGTRSGTSAPLGHSTHSPASVASSAETRIVTRKNVVLGAAGPAAPCEGACAMRSSSPGVPRTARRGVVGASAQQDASAQQRDGRERQACDGETRQDHERGGEPAGGATVAAGVRVLGRRRDRGGARGRSRRGGGRAG